jgi:hypothetical protein
MNKRSFLVISFVLFCIAFSATVKAQAKVDDKESARLFVQRFYDWSFTLFKAEGSGGDKQLSDQQIIMKHSREFFSNDLRKALVNYYNTPTKDGDIGLDFDPFMAGQDFWEGYETGNVNQAGNKFFVDVHSIKKGEPRKAVLAAELIVIAEVTKESGHWAITNFTYVDGGKKFDLLNLLKDQAKG